MGILLDYLFGSPLIYGCDVVTKSERVEKVSNYMRLFSPASSHATVSILGDLTRLSSIVEGRTVWKLSATLFKQVDEVSPVIDRLKFCKLSTNSLADHFVLCESASFVSDEKLNAAELFRNVRVTNNGTRDSHIRVDAMTVPHFGEVQIHAQRNWYDAGQQQNNSKVKEGPVVVKPL